MPPGQFTLLAFAGLLAVGGFMGWARARSRPSLIAGLGSAVVLVICWAVSRTYESAGYWSGAAVSVLLCAMFAARLRKTRKWMPSGVLLLASIVAVILLVRYALAVPATASP